MIFQINNLENHHSYIYIMYSFSFKVPEDLTYNNPTLEVYIKRHRIAKITVTNTNGSTVDLTTLDPIIETLQNKTSVTEQLTCITCSSGDIYGEELAIELRPDEFILTTMGHDTLLELVLPLDECNTNSLLNALTQMRSFLTTYRIRCW